MDKLQKRDFMASPYRSEREKLIAIQRWNVRKFFKLMDKLENFFETDKCCRLADNYLIAMVFTYFLRASLEPDEFTKENFFAALSLAYSLEEDEGEEMLLELQPWAECTASELGRLRSELFARCKYRGAVSRVCCDVVMRSAQPSHPIWLRMRHFYHSGILRHSRASREENVCPVCNGDSDEDPDC